MIAMPRRFSFLSMKYRGAFSLVLNLCLVLMLVKPGFTIAQTTNTIQGTVWNAETETVIPNASVFITNSSKGTITAANGSFTLSGIPPGTYDLVISSVGFSTQVYSFSSEKLPLTLRIYLQPKATELDAVVVEPYLKDGWEQWGRFFTDNFLGTTDASRLCRIRNYKALRFRFSKKRNVLTVSAEEPLIIDNRDLGYRIQYQLEEFKYDFGNKTLFYLGYTLFEDASEKKKTVPKRFLNARRKAYAGSIMHFARSLYNSQMMEAGFEVRRLYRTPNTEKARVRQIMRARAQININGNATTVRSGVRPGKTSHDTTTNLAADSSAYYEKIMRQKDVLETMTGYVLTPDSLMTVNADGEHVLFFNNYIHIMYRKGFEEPAYLRNNMEARKPYHPRSIVFLQSGMPVTISKNGSILPPTEFFSEGYWSWSEKISHLLPTDYDNERGR